MCIILLMAVGLWPCFWRPFRQHVTKQSALIVYSSMWMVVYVYAYIMSLTSTFQMKVFTSFGSLFLQQFSYTLSLLMKPTIIHLSFNFSNLSRYIYERNKQANVKPTVCLFVLMIIIQFCAAYNTKTYAEMAVLPLTSFFPAELNTMKWVTHYASVTVMFISGILYFPTTLLLACGILFKAELDALNKEIKANMYSSDSCAQRNFQPLRKRFHDLSDIISCTDYIFKYYNICCSLSVAAYLVQYIYFKTVSCSKLYPLDLYLVHLSFAILAFLIPCVAGHLVSSSVSSCSIHMNSLFRSVSVYNKSDLEVQLFQQHQNIQCFCTADF